jgi:hypothetical protein
LTNRQFGQISSSFDSINQILDKNNLFIKKTLLRNQINFREPPSLRLGRSRARPQPIGLPVGAIEILQPFGARIFGFWRSFGEGACP